MKWATAGKMAPIDLSNTGAATNLQFTSNVVSGGTIEQSATKWGVPLRVLSQLSKTPQQTEV